MEAHADARRRYRLEGVVQGVGFRWWTAHQANAAELRGTVRNLPDGAVEVEVEGAAVRVAALRSALAHGPRGALVRRIMELPVTSGTLPGTFLIVS